VNVVENRKYNVSEWKTEKGHECTNMGKVKRLELWWQLYVTWLPERDVQNIRPLDFCWTECTYRVCQIQSVEWWQLSICILCWTV